MIWVNHATEAWEPVVVVSNDSTSMTVRNRNGGNEYKIAGNIAFFDTVTPQALEEDCENLITLESYNEGIILHHIKKRFAADKIYTLVGNILIALNPYKTIPIYEVSMMEKCYYQVKNQEELSPHIYTIAALAIYNMKRDQKDQSVLISGESGAGKTEATKKILQFISTMSGSTASRVGRSIETQILDSNPILESFGNAKTIRNNNSSRFGKYMEVNFDKKQTIKGCNVTAYLLEKSRVVKQGPNERNYHIFYMFLAGASKDMRKEFSLKPADQFYYLMQSNCLEIEKRSDYEEWEIMIFAMDSLKVDFAIQRQIFQCLAAILHLGNITFTDSKDVEGGSRVVVPADSRRIAALLGVAEESLERALCNKDTIINGEPLLIPLTPEKAVDQRDSLAKHIYGKVFDFIVQSVNTSLFRGKPGLSIGVLDIFGFEVFQNNSFEQLCINYCNERLQTFFNEIIFESEMKMYSAEGLPIEDISYQDNMGCVRLIDLRGAGIFAYLDEEVTVPKGTDEKFVSKINQIFDENANTKSVFYLRNHKSALAFTIRHFAGDVAYNAANFLEKNRDVLPESLMKLLQTSTLSIVKSQQPDEAGVGGLSSPTPAASSKKSSKLTLCGKFKNDLDNLMIILRSTIPHFVRCIKPNLEQIPIKFEAPLVLNQLKYSGLFEAIRIRKSGFEVRLTHDQFIQRYRHCTTTPVPATINKKTMTKEYCEFLITKIVQLLTEDPYFIERKRLLEKTASNLTKKAGGTAAAAAASAAGAGTGPKGSSLPDSIVGKTRVFFRRQLLKILFDEYRDTCAENVILPIQRIVRGFLARCYFNRVLGATKQENMIRKKREGYERSLMSIEDAATYQQELIWRNDKELQKRLYDAKIQRAKDERTKLTNRRLAAATLLQKWIRGIIYGKRGRVYLCERLLELALQSRDETLMQRALQRPKELNITSKLIQLYRKHVKILILEIMNEKYVQTSLQDAIQIQSIPLLTSAIQLAKENSMSYLPEVNAAKQLLTELGNHRIVLHYLQDELSKCSSMASLMEKYDIIQFLMNESLQYPDLQGEPIIQQASYRLAKITNCYQLRQHLRHAIEICSPTKMLKAWKQRQQSVKIFGEHFLEQEANAIENMMNMLKYKQTLLTPFSSISTTSTASVAASSALRKENKKIGVDKTGGSGAKGSEGSGLEGLSSTERDEIISIAESIKDADDHDADEEESEEKRSNQDEGSKRDDEEVIETKDEGRGGEKRKSSLPQRILPKPNFPPEDDGDDEEVEGDEEEHYQMKQLNMHEIYHLVIHNTSKNDSSDNNYQLIIDYLSTLELTPAPNSNKAIPAAAASILSSEKDYIYLPRFVREPLGRMRYARNHRELDEAIANFVKLVPNEFHRKFYLRIYKWTVAFATWHQPNETLLSLQQLIHPFSSRFNSSEGPSSPNLTISVNNNNNSPGKTTSGFLLPQFQETGSPMTSTTSSPTKKKEDKRFSFTSDLRRYTPPSASNSPEKKILKKGGTYQPLTSPLSSPTKTGGTGRSLTFSPELFSSPLGSPDGNNNNYIPFAERQAKSKVAAREILKKGESKFKHVSKAEQIILETVHEYKM